MAISLRASLRSLKALKALRHGADASCSSACSSESCGKSAAESTALIVAKAADGGHWNGHRAECPEASPGAERALSAALSAFR